MSKVNPASFIKSLLFAYRGLKTLIATQQNARIHLAITATVLVFGVIVDLQISDWLWIVLAITLVFIAEGLNSAIEFLADAISPEFHPLVQKAKDVAAGAVLIAAFGASIIGTLVFYPYLFD